MKPKRYRKRVVPLTQLLGVDSVDTREYHGHVGDLIRIDPYTLFKVGKVLVAISADKAGLIEHGQATPATGTDRWLYTATSENPEPEDWSIAVTAVERPPHAPKTRPRCYGMAEDRI